jgi:DNA-binding CsgD family transcriptional regulator
MPNTFVLRCVSAPAFHFVLSPGAFILGRSRKCACRVDHQSVSRQHARLDASEGDLTVSDLESRNGTFVENNKVQKSQLKCGQSVRFGGVAFVVSLEDANELEAKSDVDTFPASRSADFPTARRLTPARQRVFDLLVQGEPDKKIAAQLQLSEHTVNNHLRAIYRAFGVDSRHELLAQLLRESGGELKQ